jgi:iron complex outermembrane receptor protein
MKKIVINILLLIGCFSVSAQNSISGKITDVSNNPLFGVEIYAPELHKGTTSDKEGNYMLTNTPNGKIKIIYSYLGYKPQVIFFDISLNKTTENIQLEEAAFAMDEIIISTPFNQLQSENVMKVERLTAKSLKKLGAITLSEGITNIPGVSQISTGTSIGKPVIRGLSGNRVLVYTQGIRLENQQFGDEHGLGINDAGISSIEVIKGPASLLYGSDALGGVLYLNPENFAPSQQTVFNFNQRYFSNTLGLNSSFGAKYSTSNWNYLTRFTFAEHSDYTIPNGQRITNSRFNETDFKAGIGYNKGPFFSEIRYNYNRSNLGLPEEITTQTTTNTLEEPYQKIDTHLLSMHQHLLFENSKLELDLGYTFNDRNEFEEHSDETGADHKEGEAPALKMALKTFSYNLKYHLPKIQEIETIFGLQGLSQTNRNFGEELLIPNADVKDFGVFITSNIQSKKNSFQAGIRFDNRSIQTERHEVVHEGDIHVFNPLDKSFNSFTASLGVKTTLFEKMTARVNLASGFRAPNLAELTSNGVHHGTNRFEEGNNQLKIEKNVQSDLVLEYKSEHFEIFGNGFYNHINDYIFLNPTGEVEDGSPVFTYIQETAKLYGGEFGFHLHPHPADWLHLESSFEMVIGKQDNGNYLPLIPANTWKNTFRTEFTIGNWLQEGYSSISLQSTFSQENVSPFESKTAAYNLVNVGFGGDFSINSLKFSTAVTINNLFNKNYINHLSRLKSNGILNPGRNLGLSVNFKL